MVASTRPDRSTIAMRAAQGERARVNVQLPATVLSYDEATQTATIKIVPCFRREDPSQGNAVVCYDPPPLAKVPVAFPGAGPYSITWPLAAGDVGRIVICDRSINEWKATGNDRTEPQDPRRHDISDAIFVPGLRSPANPLTGSSLASDAMVVSAPKLHVECADTRLGSAAASDFIALASLVEAEIDALWTAMNTHIHGGVTVGPGFTAVSGTLGSAGSVGATKVRAE